MLPVALTGVQGAYCRVRFGEQGIELECFGRGRPHQRESLRIRQTKVVVRPERIRKRETRVRRSEAGVLGDDLLEQAHGLLGADFAAAFEYGPRLQIQIVGFEIRLVATLSP